MTATINYACSTNTICTSTIKIDFIEVFIIQFVTIVTIVLLYMLARDLVDRYRSKI